MKINVDTNEQHNEKQYYQAVQLIKRAGERKERCKFVFARKLYDPYTDQDQWRILERARIVYILKYAIMWDDGREDKQLFAPYFFKYPANPILDYINPDAKFDDRVVFFYWKPIQWGN